MFKLIRNRFLLLNMVMVSTVVITAFIIIYAIVFSRVQSDNSNKLTLNATTRMAIPISVVESDEALQSESGETSKTGFYAAGFDRLLSPNAGLSFSLLTDAQGNVVRVNSMVDLPDAVYNQAAKVAVKEKNAPLLLEGRRWQYIISPVMVVFSDPYGTSISITGEYSDIRFLDVTDSYQMLRTLALTLTGLTLVILTVFFFISRFFANRAIRPMEEAWEKQNRFVADASHELKTPLSVINANCGVLYANKDEFVESQLKWVDRIMSSSDRMAGLVSNLLSLAQMEDAEHETITTAFDFSLLVEDAAAEMEAAALDKGLRITKNIEPDITLKNDRENVRQILSILLDNAVKYTDNGGDIMISLKNTKHQVLCKIRNSGEGIPAEDLPRLFDRFYRGDPARSSENSGYGLGLAIAKTIAERLGAKLSANSETGEYTEFVFSIATRS